MGSATQVILFCGIFDRGRNTAAINQWIEGIVPGNSLVEVDSWAGNFYTVGGNWLRLGEFLDFLRTLQWADPQELFVLSIREGDYAPMLTQVFADVEACR